MRVVSQPALLEKLVEEASGCPSFSFERGARFRDLLHDRDGRVVGAALEKGEGREEVRADLVIGCDGRGSVVGCWVQDDDGVVSVVLCHDIGDEGTRALDAEASRLTEWLGGHRVGTVYTSPLMRSAR